jgi:predicted DNA-binding transcriptional regulator AlpA
MTGIGTIERAASGPVLSPLLLDAKRTAELLGWSVSHVWRQHAAGLMPAPMHSGRLTQWRRRELEAWVDAGMPPRDRWVWPTSANLTNRT